MGNIGRSGKGPNPSGNSGTPEPSASPVVLQFPCRRYPAGTNSEKRGTGPEQRGDLRWEWMREHIDALQWTEAGGGVVWDVEGNWEGNLFPHFMRPIHRSIVQSGVWKKIFDALGGAAPAAWASPGGDSVKLF
jgi:hypothetical protein